MGYDKRRLLINSLSTPFFVSCGLTGQAGQDLLFWQEPVGDEIPGNMQIILKRQAGRTGTVYVQKKQAYDKLLALGADPQIVQEKGFVYPFQRKNLHRPEALICTNSDQIEHCGELVSALPQMQFHIAALTEMSSKLLSLGSCPNVHLYPAPNRRYSSISLKPVTFIWTSITAAKSWLPFQLPF